MDVGAKSHSLISSILQPKQSNCICYPKLVLISMGSQLGVGTAEEFHKGSMASSVKCPGPCRTWTTASACRWYKDIQIQIGDSDLLPVVLVEDEPAG